MFLIIDPKEVFMASTKSILHNLNVVSCSLLMTCAPCCMLSAAEAPATAKAEHSSAKQLSREFASIAKIATPAVVSIRTQYAAKRSEPQRSEGWEDQPNDPFQDEFWQRFFGFPTPQRPEKKAPKMAQGSGFVVSKDGYILTNNHVVQDADQITVLLNDGREFTAKTIGTDPNTDIALLKIDGENFPYLKLGNSDQIDIGEWVIAIGNPLGLQASVTVGVVSAKGRNDLDIARVEEFIQTDAAINRGNSGGCLLNLEGEVVGMNTAIASNTGGYMGIGFAIPSNLLEHIMDQLRNSGHVVRGFLGVSLQKIDAKLAQAFNLSKSEGALVSEVVKDSPADKAGLRSGDVILKINNLLIENAGSLRNSVSMLKPGETVLLTVMRNKKEMVIRATVGTHPENEIAAVEVQNKVGVLVQDLTADLAQQLGYETDKGVLIKYIDPSSNASDVGLKRGQVILSVNQTPVRTAEEFYKVVQENASNKRLLLQIKAGQTVRYVTIELQ